MRRLPAVIVTVLLVLLLGVAVVTAVVAGPGSSTGPAAASPPSAAPGTTEPASPSAAPGQAAAPTSVAFLGDGYTSGTPAGGQGPANYTAILAEQEKWATVTSDAVFGSGYVADPALQTRLQKVVAANPQLVVVTAGRADDQADPAAVGQAATKLYSDLKTGLPQAKVVVIGPMWLGTDPSPQGIAVRDAIKSAAEQAQLPFVDPIDGKWFLGGLDQDGIAPGNEILNDKGHQRLAQLVDAALKQNGTLPK